MKKVYFTITGMNYYYGTDIVEKGKVIAVTSKGVICELKKD